MTNQHTDNMLTWRGARCRSKAEVQRTAAWRSPVSCGYKPTCGFGRAIGGLPERDRRLHEQRRFLGNPWTFCLGCRGPITSASPTPSIGHVNSKKNKYKAGIFFLPGTAVPRTILFKGPGGGCQNSLRGEVRFAFGLPVTKVGGDYEDR